MVLASSESEPPRRTIARSSRPVSEMVFMMPVAIASTDSSTPTTPAMPMTMTNEVPSRCGTLRRFIAEIDAICLSDAHVCISSAPRQRVDDC